MTTVTNCIGNVYELVSHNAGTITILGLVLLCISVVITISFVLWCWVSVYSYEKVKKVLQSSSTSHNEYDKESKGVLHEYKNRRVSRIHICRHPLPRQLAWIVEVIKQYKRINVDTKKLHHYFLILEVESKNGYTKLIQLDKCLRSVATLTIQANKQVELESVQIKEDLKVKDLIRKTINSYGRDKYFNWDPGTNCTGLVCEASKAVGVFGNLKFAKDIEHEQEILLRLFDLDERYTFAIKTILFLLDSLVGQNLRLLEIILN